MDKRTETICELQYIVEDEGFDYGLENYGRSRLEKIGDEDVLRLFHAWQDAKRNLESALDALFSEVEDEYDEYEPD